LKEGLNNDKIKEACQAALYGMTGEEQYLQPLIEKLDAGQYVGYEVVRLVSEKDTSSRFKEAVERKKIADKEREEQRKMEEELGVECWEPEEEQLERFKTTKKLDLTHRRTRTLHSSLVETLSGEEGVTEIELCDNRLTSIPTELVRFKNTLKKLNLQANRLKGALEGESGDTLGQLTSLESLGFHGNSLEGE